MIAVDDAALRCDFMETYHIPDYKALPARQAALFACGLRDGSRIKMALAGAAAPPETLLLAGILDGVRWLCWANSQAAQDGEAPPPSVLNNILRRGEPRESVGFDSPEDFNAWNASMTGA